MSGELARRSDRPVHAARRYGRRAPLGDPLALATTWRHILDGLKLRLCALERALSFVGVRETPPHSNRGPEIDRWNRAAGLPLGQPWCMSFVQAMYAACGRTIGGGGGVERFERWAESHGYIVARPLRGDVVCYDWDGAGWADHVGIVVRVLALRWRGRQFAGWVRTVEGNTSWGDDSNGGRVMIRYRWIRYAKFARIE